MSSSGVVSCPDDPTDVKEEELGWASVDGSSSVTFSISSPLSDSSSPSEIKTSLNHPKNNINKGSMEGDLHSLQKKNKFRMRTAIDFLY